MAIPGMMPTAIAPLTGVSGSMGMPVTPMGPSGPDPGAAQTAQQQANNAYSSQLQGAAAPQVGMNRDANRGGDSAPGFMPSNPSFYGR